MISEAILRLRPNSSWSLNGNKYEDLNWLDEVQTKPTKQEVEDKVAELIIEVQQNAYKKQRAFQYPSINDQLDMLWHAIDNGTLNKTSEFYTAIKAVKDAYPKSE